MPIIGRAGPGGLTDASPPGIPMNHPRDGRREPHSVRVKGCAGEFDDLTPAEVEATYYLRQSQPDAA